MRPTFKKLEVKDIGNLERLVAENVEGIEPGLKVVDSRLLLGQAAIDLVGLDARGSLALIALDFTADEGLLLRVMDAYSWCLEYPDTLRRLYPMAQVSTSKPPRILFIAERLTDSFLRRIKQLSFLEIDCLEFRHLEVNGESVVYFDHVERLRKSVVESPAEVSALTPTAPGVATVVEPRAEPVRSAVAKPLLVGVVEVEPVRVEPRAQASSIQAPVASPSIGAAPVSPAVSEYQSVALGTEPAAAVSRDASAAERVVAKPAVVAAEPLVVAKPVVAEPIVAAEPVVVAKPAVEPLVVAKPVIATEPPVVTEPAIAEEPVVFAEPALAVAEPDAVPSALQLQAIEATASLSAVESTVSRNGAENIHSDIRIDVGPRVAESVAAAMPSVVTPSNAPVAEVEAPAEIIVPAAPQPINPAPVQAPPVWAKPQAQPNGNRPYFFAQATKGASPVEAPVAAVAAPVAESSAPVRPGVTKAAVEVDDRPELESLSFPKDGLSRQWLEFLSQLGATK